MKTATIKHLCAFLVLGTALSVSESAQCQDRTWKNADGREISARAISKTEETVTLRLENGKRVPIELKKLSQEDLDWLAKWTPPITTVTASMQSVGWSGSKRIEKRRFEFKCTHNCELNIFEDELAGVIPALKEIFELAKKPTDDVTSYSKVVLKGKAIGVPGVTDILIFKVKAGKSYCGGWGMAGSLGGYDSSVPISKLYALHDFLETFSVSEWDRKKDEIKRRFE